MRLDLRCALTGLLLAGWAVCALAAGTPLAVAPATAPSSVTAAPASVDDSPAVVAEQFHEALRQGQRDKVLSLLSPDLIVFESGYSEDTLQGYAGNGHLDDDLRFAGGTTRVVDTRDVIQSGDVACVMVRAHIVGTYEKQPVNLIQTETMVLKRTALGWRIAHIHWSGHSGAQ